MTNKIFFAIIACISCFALNCAAQKELSANEIQYFFGLIKQTKEFKIIRGQTDSINKAQGASSVPQEIDLKMLKKESDATPDDFIFYGALERKLAIGISIDRYIFQYNKQKKQIISTTHEQTGFRMN